MVRSSTLSDVSATIEDIFGEGDRVAVRWTFRGVYRGEAKPGFPNPGEPCTIVAISTYRFVDGKIEDDWASKHSGTETHLPRSEIKCSPGHERSSVGVGLETICCILRS